MIQNAVLDAQVDSLREQTPPLPQEAVAAEVDVVQELLEAVHRPGSALAPLPDVRVRRPFDAQYWACWVAATVSPVLMTYLWITR
jgi:hypothetical protein